MCSLLILSLAAASSTVVSSPGGSWPRGKSPADVSVRVSRQFLSADPCDYRPQGFGGGGMFAAKGYGLKKGVHYSVVSLWANAIECARKRGDKPLLNELLTMFEPMYDSRHVAQTQLRHVDFTVFGALPASVYLASGDKRAAALALKYADMQWEKPGENDPYPAYARLPPLAERMALWSKGYTSQTRLWIDDMYMITFLQTQAYRVSGNRLYLERTAREMALYLDRIQLENGLFNHASNGPFTWSRGNGWMAAGMSLLLEYLPSETEEYGRILRAYRLMMATLLKYQRPSGLWGQIVTDSGSWDETSGSAMFAYAFQSGVNRGLLDGAVYGPAVRKAYLSLVDRLDDRANLADVCEGTGPGSTREHYLARNRVNGDPHGQAPLMWLCRALLEAPVWGISPAGCEQ